jgi:hypothetical protein
MPEQDEIQSQEKIIPRELSPYLSLPQRANHERGIILEKVKESCLFFEPQKLSFTFSKKIDFIWTQSISFWNLGEGNLYISDVQCLKEWLKIEKNVCHKSLSGFPVNLEIRFEPDSFALEKDTTSLTIQIKSDGMPFKTIEIPIVVERNERKVLYFSGNGKPFGKTIDFGLIPYEDECEFRFRYPSSLKKEKVHLLLQKESQKETKIEMESHKLCFAKRLSLDDGSYKYSFLIKDKSRRNELVAKSVFGGDGGVKVRALDKKKKRYVLDLRRKQRIIKFENRGTEDLNITIKSCADWLQIEPAGEDFSFYLNERCEYDFNLHPDQDSKDICLFVDRNKLDRTKNFGEVEIRTNSNLTGQRVIKIDVVADYDYLLPTYKLISNSLYLGSIYKGRKIKVPVEIENLGKETLEVSVKNPPLFLSANTFSVEGRTREWLYFELNTSNLEIGTHACEIKFETNGYPLGGQEMKLKVRFEIYAYLTNVDKLNFGTMRKGQIRSTEVEIKHSHGDETDLKIVPNSKYSRNFELRGIEKDDFRVFFIADDQVPSNGIFSDHLELVDLVNHENVRLPFEVKIV